jgi:6-phosphogluconolactonase (cycloisomerase 2 family)
LQFETFLQISTRVRKMLIGIARAVVAFCFCGSWLNMETGKNPRILKMPTGMGRIEKYFPVLLVCVSFAARGSTDSSAALPVPLTLSPTQAPVPVSAAPSPLQQAPIPVIGSPLTVKFPGKVFQAVVTQDGTRAFASLSGVPPAAIASSASSPVSAATATAPQPAKTVGAVAVLEKSSRGWHIQGYVRLNGQALGLALFPDQSTLAVAAGTAGLALINVRDAVAGTAQPVYVRQGASVLVAGNGTIGVAVGNDNRFVFVANEYGRASTAPTIGNIGVVSIQKDNTGHVNGTLTGNISTGQDVIPGVTLSPDGSTLYVANEESTGMTVHGLRGFGNPATGLFCSARSGTAVFSGSVSVIDVARAEAQPDASAIVSTVAAGCETTRIAVSPDNMTIWVTARGSHAVYAFDATRLRSDPANAFISAFDSAGSQPVGIAVFGSGRYLAVGNSNRSQTTHLGPNGLPMRGIQNVTIFRITNPTSLTRVQTVASGLFPRSLSVSPDGLSLLIPNFASKTLQIAPIALPSLASVAVRTRR